MAETQITKARAAADAAHRTAAAIGRARGRASAADINIIDCSFIAGTIGDTIHALLTAVKNEASDTASRYAAASDRIMRERGMIVIGGVHASARRLARAYTFTDGAAETIGRDITALHLDGRESSISRPGRSMLDPARGALDAADALAGDTTGADASLSRHSRVLNYAGQAAQSLAAAWKAFTPITNAAYSREIGGARRAGAACDALNNAVRDLNAAHRLLEEAWPAIAADGKRAAGLAATT